MRNFSPQKRSALRMISGGTCASCHRPLPQNWHADHVTPYSKGGPTDVLNGQALCPDCNLRKGSKVYLPPPWPASYALRAWQTAALRGYSLSPHKDFLVVATPAAGKTTFALRVCHDVLRDGQVPRVCIVVPTVGLKYQWHEDAAKVGLKIDPNWSNRLDGMIPADIHGVAVTYAQVASNPEIFRALCGKGLVVVFDEVHHAGEDENLTWGPALRQAFGPAYRRLLLSGTPFRTDGHQIPFVRYEQGRSQADFSYSYANALTDGVCRAVWFPSYEATMDWRSNGQYFSHAFSDPLKRPQQSERLRTAVTEDTWLHEVITESNTRLQDLRLNGHPDAGGLIVAMDQYRAREIVKLIKKITKHDAVLVVSDEPEAIDRLKHFKRGRQQWLVAVRMVSEGVDIPRLRVGVYATNIVSELFFRQFVGRFVRWQRDGGKEQDAYVYIPADVRILDHAKAIMQERYSVIKEDFEAKRREAATPRDPSDDARGMFLPIGVSDVHKDQVITGGLTLHPYHMDQAQQMMDMGGFSVPIEALAKSIALMFPDQLAPVGPPRPHTDPRHAESEIETRNRLRQEVTSRAKALGVLRGNKPADHKQVWWTLKQLDGTEYYQATADQLYVWIQVLDTWIAEEPHES